MKILLVTFAELLPKAVNDFLNKKNFYSAVVVDEVEQAKKFLSQFDYPRENIFPFYDLRECVEKIDCDCVVLVAIEEFREFLSEQILKCDLSEKFFVSFSAIESEIYNFGADMQLRYYEEYFEGEHIFATGISYSQCALDNSEFKYRLMNLARPSQDLYYDLKTAEKIFSYKIGKVKYVLIGLAPYSFHYDLSKSKTISHRILPYYIAHRDVHNLIPKELYHKIFNEDYLKTVFRVGRGFFERFIDTLPTEKQNIQTKVNATWEGYEWDEKNFPDTVQENIKILDDYLTLCEKNFATPIIFLPPMPKGYRKHFDKQKLAEFYQIIESMQILHPKSGFLDGWKLGKLFPDEYFADSVHFNFKGSKKFSRIFNSLILNLEQG